MLMKKMSEFRQKHECIHWYTFTPTSPILATPSNVSDCRLAAVSASLISTPSRKFLIPEHPLRSREVTLMRAPANSTFY